jgi:hypothetical protein
MGPDRAPVVQAKDRAVGRPRQHPVYYGISLRLPIIADGGPHDAAQAEAALGLAETEPARAEGGSQQRGGKAGGVLDGALGTGKFPIDKLRRMKAEQRMGVAVVADFVAGVDGAGDLGRRSTFAPI